MKLKRFSLRLKLEIQISKLLQIHFSVGRTFNQPDFWLRLYKSRRKMHSPMNEKKSIAPSSSGLFESMPLLNSKRVSTLERKNCQNKRIIRVALVPRNLSLLKTRAEQTSLWNRRTNDIWRTYTNTNSFLYQLKTSHRIYKHCSPFRCVLT